MLEIAPNFLKGLPYACKWISKCLRDYLYRFRENSLGSEIGRFWAKILCYGPWFWTWRIWLNFGNRSKLSERPPICFKWISKSFQDYLYGFRKNSLGSEIGRFWAKSLGYSPWFWTWRILAKFWKSLQTFWKASYMLANGFLNACGTICIDFGRIR